MYLASVAMVKRTPLLTPITTVGVHFTHVFEIFFASLIFVYVECIFPFCIYIFTYEAIEQIQIQNGRFGNNLSKLGKIQTALSLKQSAIWSQNF